MPPLRQSSHSPLISLVFLPQNWLGLGCILATLCREIANRHLTAQTSSTHVRQQVEWLYAFDIHCNSFFPVFVLLCKSTSELLRFLHMDEAFGGFRNTVEEKLTIKISVIRWCPIFLTAVRSWRRLAAFSSIQPHVCLRIIVVLVHHTSRISISSILEQHGSVFISHCCCLPTSLGYTCGLSPRSGLQCRTCHGSLLFYVEKLSNQSLGYTLFYCL